MQQKAEGFASEKIVVLPSYMLGELASHPIIRQLYVTDIGFFPFALHHYRERPDGCDSHILIYCADGEGWVSADGGAPYRLEERSLTVIPAGTPHAYGADESDPWSIYWFHFKGELSSAFVEPLAAGVGGELPLSTSDADKFIGLFDQIVDLLATKSYSTPHHLHVSQLAGCLLSLLGLVPGRKEERKKLLHIEGALNYMRTKLEGDLTLEEVALNARISKQHLNHLFKTATGYAPIDYYHRMKMQRACQLLDLTDLSVKEIGDATGFKDPYYFSRLFKKLIGLSPTAYRNKLKG